MKLRLENGGTHRGSWVNQANQMPASLKITCGGYKKCILVNQINKDRRLSIIPFGNSRIFTCTVKKWKLFLKRTQKMFKYNTSTIDH